MTTTVLELNVSGIICRACEDAIADALLHTRGVVSAQAHYWRGRVTITYDPNIVTEDTLRQELTNAGYPPGTHGMGGVVDSQVPFNLPGYSDANTEGYDLEKAKAYLAQSGVDPASVTLSIICSNDTKKRAGEVIQANLQEVLGINATIESMDLATYLSATAEGDYTGAIGGYTSSTMVGYLIGVYHSKSIGASNKTRTNDPEIDALIDKAATTIDETERNKYLEECSALLNAQCPQIPLYQPTALRAYNSDLKGVEVNASGTMYFENLSW